MNLKQLKQQLLLQLLFTDQKYSQDVKLGNNFDQSKLFLEVAAIFKFEIKFKGKG